MAMRNEDVVLFLSLLVLAVGLGIEPQVDRVTWSIEMLPLFGGLPVLFATYRRFAFTQLAYRLMWVLGVLIVIGAHFGYSEAPLFSWLRDSFELSRNYFDRLAHLVLGVTAAVVVREMLLRLSWLGRGSLLFFLVTATVLALASVYEMFEWWVALARGEAAAPFLAVQGDSWDSQWDTLLTAVGAILGQLLLTGRHDVQIGAMDPTLLYRK